jgi:hypothetical protein
MQKVARLIKGRIKLGQLRSEHSQGHTRLVQTEGVKFNGPASSLLGLKVVIAGEAAVNRSDQASAKRWMKAVLTLVFAIFAAGLLTACDLRRETPPQQLVGQAIALQVERTQQLLSPALKLPVPTLKEIGINHIQIAEQTPLTILGQVAYRLQGTYDLTLQPPSTQQSFPFEVYLLKRGEGKTATWQVAEPKAGDWETRSLPIGPPIGESLNHEPSQKS